MTAVTTTHIPIRQTARTTQQVRTIFPTMIIGSRITGHRSTITAHPPMSGGRTFATIHGMTIMLILGIHTHIGMGRRIGDGVTAIGGITAAMDIEATAADAAEITSPAGQELSEACAVESVFEEEQQVEPRLQAELPRGQELRPCLVRAQLL